MTPRHLRRISIAFAAALALPQVSLQADQRAFTNKAGKAITAELTGVKSGKAMLKIGDKTFAAPIDQLVAEDQAYIAKWLETNVSYQFRILTAQREGLPKDWRGPTLRAPTIKLPTGFKGKEETTATTSYRELEITNMSSADVKDFVVEYRILLRQKRPVSMKNTITKTETLYHQLGSDITVAGIAKGETVSLSTDPADFVSVHSRKKEPVGWEPGKTWLSSTPLKTVTRKIEEEPAGIWIRIVHKDSVVAELRDFDEQADRETLTWAATPANTSPPGTRAKQRPGKPPPKPKPPPPPKAKTNPSPSGSN